MTGFHISELRLTSFKSFRNAVLPIDDITLLIGRNSSGKSNALDGLDVLARLADGEDIADALDGRRREDGTVRGGSRGCAPHGDDSFTLGCTVTDGTESFAYDVTVQVAPTLRVAEETLYGSAELFSTESASSDSSGINLPDLSDNRLALCQIPLALTGSTEEEGDAVRASVTVAATLREVFHLEPVPDLMRYFVPARDTDLRRTGENLSAALCRLKETSPSVFHDIVELSRQVADDRVTGITFATSSLDDVMLQLEEYRAGRATNTPAREMSDGMLRFICIATALKSSVEPPGLRTDAALRGSTHIVLDELENGMHASLAGRVLDLVKSSFRTTGTRVLATTHSPALLDAAEGSLNDSIIVCHIDPDTGLSQLTRLTELDGYARALAEGSLGTAVSAGKLADNAPEAPDYSAFKRFLGV